MDNALTLEFYIYAENDLETIELKSKSFISKFYMEDLEWNMPSWNWAPPCFDLTLCHSFRVF